MTRWLLSAAALGTITGLALTFGTYGALGVAVCAAAVIVFFGVRAVRVDKRRARDKAYHPSVWVVPSQFLNHHQGRQVRSADPDRRYL